MTLQNRRVPIDPETAPGELAALLAAVQQVARATREGDRIAAVAAAHTAEQSGQRLTDRLLAEATTDKTTTRRGLAEALGLPSHGALQRRINRHHNRDQDQED